MDEDSVPSEKEEEKQVTLLNSKNLLRDCQNKTVIYVRQEGVTELDLDENYVTITINPDEQGRFGFNVKGGADLETPVSHFSLKLTTTTSSGALNFIKLPPHVPKHRFLFLFS